MSKNFTIEMDHPSTFLYVKDLFSSRWDGEVDVALPASYILFLDPARQQNSHCCEVMTLLSGLLDTLASPMLATVLSESCILVPCTEAVCYKV